MHQQRTCKSGRAGFTLVELMVVILIISILSALLTMAVTQGIRKAKVVRNRTEIAQLAAAIDAFKAYYKVEYIPSRIFLSEQGNYPGTAAESLAYLQRLWPKLGPNVDWNGSSIIESDGAGGNFWLEGDQCLVFFLGGIPGVVNGVPTCTGFSTNPANPAIHTTTTGATVRPPMYEFDSSRLVVVPHGAFKPFATRMFSYLDTYGTSNGNGTLPQGSISRPYLYFSSYQSRNGYNRYAQITGTSDCSPAIDPTSPNLVFQPVWPYAQGNNQYLNPTGFQIISAGADQKFGSGTSDATKFWTPATAANSGAIDMIVPSAPAANLKGAGADDQANFYDNLLGTPSIN